MRALHHALMGALLVAVVAFSAGAVHPWTSTAMAQDRQAGAARHDQAAETRPGHSVEAQHGHSADAQHGHTADADAHLDAIADYLDLSAAQKEALVAPLAQAVAAMQELHGAHDAIVAELTDEQAEKFAEIMHGMIGEMMGEASSGAGDGLDAPVQRR